MRKKFARCSQKSLLCSRYDSFKKKSNTDKIALAATLGKLGWGLIKGAFKGGTAVAKGATTVAGGTLKAAAPAGKAGLKGAWAVGKKAAPAAAGIAGNAALETALDKDHTEVHGFGNVFMDKVKDPMTLASGTFIGFGTKKGLGKLANRFSKAASLADLNLISDKNAGFLGNTAFFAGMGALTSTLGDKESRQRIGTVNTLLDKVRDPKLWLASGAGAGLMHVYTPIHNAAINDMAGKSGIVGKVGRALNSKAGKMLDPTAAFSIGSMGLGMAGVPTPYDMISRHVSDPNSKLYSGLKGRFWNKTKSYKSPVREDSF